MAAWVKNVLTLSSPVGQEELAVLRRQLEGKDLEVRRLQDETSYKSTTPSGAEPTDRGENAFGLPGERARRRLTSHPLKPERFYQVCVQQHNTGHPGFFFFF